MTFSVTVLGSNSSTPTSKRFPTSQLVNSDEKLFLIDCAEGTQMQLRNFGIRFQRIDNIFISHMHGDHFFGLIGLISTMNLLGRTKELSIYSPKELELIINVQLDVSLTQLGFPLVFYRIEEGFKGKIYENNVLIVETFPLDHKIQTQGFLFKEKTKERKISKTFLDMEDVPLEEIAKIKKGSDYVNENGKIFANKDITIDPPPSRSYAYCSDTKYNESILPFIRKANLLYHEATFMNNLKDVAREKYHSTTLDAANIAKLAGVKQLMIGHYSARYEKLDPLLKETKKYFRNSILAIEGVEYKIV